MLKNKYDGKFIVIEGLDGSGESTMAEMLAEYLKTEKDVEVVLTKEPTKDSETGLKIKEILDQKQTIEAADFQKLFSQDRYEHLEKTIIPALQAGKFVVCDRYFFSTFAFGASAGLDLEWLIRLNDGFIYPDLTIFLKVRPEISLERIEKRGTDKKFFENLGNLTRAAETFEILPERFNDIVVLDGEKSIPEVFEKIKKVVQDRILDKIIKMPELR